jgi:hypothetical protein
MPVWGLPADRLKHRAVIIAVDGESDRLKEARECSDAHTRQRGVKKSIREGAGT